MPFNSYDLLSVCACASVCVYVWTVEQVQKPNGAFAGNWLPVRSLVSCKPHGMLCKKIASTTTAWPTLNVLNMHPVGHAKRCVPQASANGPQVMNSLYVCVCRCVGLCVVVLLPTVTLNLPQQLHFIYPVGRLLMGVWHTSRDWCFIIKAEDYIKNIRELFNI